MKYIQRSGTSCTVRHTEQNVSLSSLFLLPIATVAQAILIVEEVKFDDLEDGHDAETTSTSDEKDEDDENEND